MTSTPTLDTAATRDVAEFLEAEFVEVVCGDEDLLRAEFDAIVAAEEWPVVPPRRPGIPAARPPRRGPRFQGTPAEEAPAAGDLQERRPRWVRERSPPAADTPRLEYQGRAASH